MAYLVPSDIANLALAGARSPELETLARLRDALPASYTVFHGVHWTREYAGHTVFGEVDFVVVNRAGDALVIEQKNGALDETGEGLMKRYPDGAKNVAVQVRRGLESIREKFKWQHPAAPPLRLDYLVYLPDHRVVALAAAGLDRGRIVDAGDGDLAGRIARVLGPGGDADGERHERALAFFRQTFEIAPDIHRRLSSQERAFTRLSGGLVRTLGNIERSPLRLRVRGTAGCGKSLVALRFHERAVAAGRRPLLVCFNRPLAERLKAVAPAGGMVNTWYGLCRDFLEARGHRLDFRRARSDLAFWQNVQDMVLAEPASEDWQFDPVIVDEGQDFEPEWYDLLRLFSPGEADVLWLEDRDQNLRGMPPVPLPGFVGYRADANYRTPETIARFILGTLPFRFGCANDLPGLGVGVTPYGDAADQPGHVARIVGELVRQGFAPSDVIILSLRGTGKSALADHDRVGNFTLARFTGAYDELGNQNLTAGQVRLESVYRFKGQQAPAVVVIDVDPDECRRERERAALFAAMTRATVRLELLVRRYNSLNAELLT